MREWPPTPSSGSTTTGFLSRLLRPATRCAGGDSPWRPSCLPGVTTPLIQLVENVLLNVLRLFEVGFVIRLGRSQQSVEVDG